MGLVHAQFTVAHDHQEQFAVVAEGHLDGSQVVGGGDELIHFALFGLDDVEADCGAQGEEMVEAVVAPDGGEAEVVG